jgi:hypothetical protein
MLSRACDRSRVFERVHLGAYAAAGRFAETRSATRGYIARP